MVGGIFAIVHCGRIEYLFLCDYFYKNVHGGNDSCRNFASSMELNIVAPNIRFQISAVQEAVRSKYSRVFGDIEPYIYSSAINSS